MLIKQRRLDEEERLLWSIELRNQVGFMSGILWNNLAEIAGNRSAPSLSDIEDCYGHGVKIYTLMFGASHPQLGAIYNGWGLSLENSGEIGMAVEMYERSLAVRKEMLGEMHQDLVPTLSNLVACYMCSNRMEEALACEDWIGRIVGKEPLSVGGDASVASHFRFQSRIARHDVIHLILTSIQGRIVRYAHITHTFNILFPLKRAPEMK